MIGQGEVKMLAFAVRTRVSALALVMTVLALVIPANATGKPLFGAWTPGDPYGGTTHGTDALEAAIDRRVDIVPWYQNWGGGAWISSVQPHIFEGVKASGRIPLVTWEPHDPNNWGTNQPDYRLERIVRGDFDAYITRWADDLRAIGTPVYLRTMHEMNGNWYPWGPTVNGNSAQLFREAWRRMHDIFTAHGATNVRWVWSPLNIDVPGTAGNRLEDLYPGAQYVDVLATGGYNWGSERPDFGGWQSFSTIFSGVYERLKRLGPQPIWITEVASDDRGGDKAAWVRDMFATAAGMDRLEAIVWFNEDKEGHWRAAPTAEVAAAFANGTARTASSP